MKKVLASLIGVAVVGWIGVMISAMAYTAVAGTVPVHADDSIGVIAEDQGMELVSCGTTKGFIVNIKSPRGKYETVYWVRPYDFTDSDTRLLIQRVTETFGVQWMRWTVSEQCA